MADNLSVRNLGGVGIVSDVHPYDLPPNALSAGVNVRFDNGKIGRGPVPRRIYEFAGAQASHAPGHLFSIPPISGGGAETLISVAQDYGTIYSVLSGSITAVTHAGAVANDTGDPFSSTFLGGVAYLNRKSFVPLKKASGDATFVTLPAWDATWRAGVMRSYKDFLVGLNIVKGATDYPSMVKWSDVATFGSAPTTWDHTVTTNSAGENILNDMRGGLIDGLALRDSFILYGENEVWAMNHVGGPFIFDFRKRFDDVGILNTNCVVEVDGQHFVFDVFDVYAHDGVSKRSLAHGRVKEFVFGGLMKDLAHLAFVAHNPKLNEVLFCYPSNDRYTTALPSTGCNRAAVYNYRNDTWTFYSLPNVTASTIANLVTGDTWTTNTSSWATVGGSWRQMSDTDERHLMFCGRADTPLGLTASRIYGLDLITGSSLARPTETEALVDCYAERIGLDLDDSGAPLRAYKSLLTVFPQLSLSNDTTTVQFSFGANDIVGQDPVWDTYQSFDPETMSKLDTRVAGRYLGWRSKLSGNGDFGLSGLDAEVAVRGTRG